MWGFEDCNSGEHCGAFEAQHGSEQSLEERLRAILKLRPWDYVVTHNQHGEYFHYQHVGVHNAVKKAIAASFFSPPPRLLVFNPLPELNVSLSPGKARMAYHYASGPQIRAWIMHNLLQYSEHLVPEEEFLRPDALRLFFSSAKGESSGNFWYTTVIIGAWPMEFTAATAVAAADELLLAPTWSQSCVGRADQPLYPNVCKALYRHAFSPEKEDPVREKFRLMQDEVDRGYNLSYPETTTAGADVATALADADGAATASGALRCLRPEPLRRFGGLRGWMISGASRGPVLLELLVLRPITVGWRQGYKGRTYKVLGSSGAVRVDLSAGSAFVPHDGEPIAVQPHDLLGWGVFGASAGELTIADLGRRTSVPLCLGARGCDEAGLCAFDSEVPLETAGVAAVDAIAPMLGPRPEFPRGVLRRPYEVRPSLDLTAYVEPSTSYEEFMTLRQRLRHPDLSLFEDKIRLRLELLPEVGVRPTPSIHLSHTDFDVARRLRGRNAFVVKPSHMSESQSVFVVHNGVDLLRSAWGWKDAKVTPEQIQAQVDAFRNHTALDWECNALTAVRPGVVVEELVLAQDEFGKSGIHEYKFYTVWGRVFFGEMVPSSSGAAMEISRDGVIATETVGCPPLCLAPCYARMVEIAEQVAGGARTDFLRVDVLIAGACEDLFVSEVELFPASDFSQELKDLIAGVWRSGYGM